MIFATAAPILFTSFVYHTNVYCSVIHGIKIKPHLSVVWKWYHFVAIASPTDSADINTRLQLSDTSSLQPMHGGFLLIQTKWFVARYLQIVHLPNGGPRAILGNEIYIYMICKFNFAMDECHFWLKISSFGSQKILWRQYCHYNIPMGLLPDT